MSIRDQLLHSEIQHLGQMLQMLSYELTVLQDFIQEKYGNKDRLDKVFDIFLHGLHFTYVYAYGYD